MTIKVGDIVQSRTVRSLFPDCVVVDVNRGELHVWIGFSMLDVGCGVARCHARDVEVTGEITELEIIVFGIPIETKITIKENV